jgi:uncharacterized alkaline shock family protein YloU
MSENKDYMTLPQDYGTVHISEEVISSIAALAIADVEGVSGLSAGIGSDIAELVGKKSLSKGIKLTMEEQTVRMDCFVVLLYGYAIPEVAKNIQDSVTAAVESMTGLTVTEINVNVTGISLGKK